MIKHTKNTPVSTNLLIANFLSYSYTFSNDVYFNLFNSILDLPEDAKVLDMNEVINLDASQIQTEMTGAQIVKEIQEWLLSKEVPEEIVVLPEDTTQHLLVGLSMFCIFFYLFHTPLLQHKCCLIKNIFYFQVCNQLELATHIEMTAGMLWLDAIQLMKTILGGTATDKLHGVLEGAFSSPGHVPVAAEEPEEEEEGLEQDLNLLAAAEPSTSGHGTKRKLPTPTGVSKKKGSHPSKGSVCSLNKANNFFPLIKDKDKYLHAGVEDRFISSRQSSSLTKDAGYGCLYSKALKADGKVIPDCSFFLTSKAQLNTHVRQFHLGIAGCCYVCSKHWWSASSWHDHMRRSHSELKEEDFYVREGLSGDEMKSLIIKKEVEEVE